MINRKPLLNSRLRISSAPRGGRSAWVLAALAAGLWVIPSWAQTATRPAEVPGPDVGEVVKASLEAERSLVQAGHPVWVRLSLVNLTDRPVTLRVPELSSETAAGPEMGLPFEHIFSGPGFTGVLLEDDKGERHDSKVSIRPPANVPFIRLAPYGSVGLRVDLTKYYTSLLRPGDYRLTWRPYNATISSSQVKIEVLAERQAMILTDLGKMTVRFYYDQAPHHVANFIELIEERFYDNLTFNRIVPGGLIQGGDPLDNRRGVRKDGKRLKAEFSSIPFELGTVGMARSPHDPDSASSQFFICLNRQPSLDGQQTPFGYLVGDESFETLRKIAAVPTTIKNGMEDYPRKPVFIRAVSLENVPNRERRGTSEVVPASRPAPGVEVIQIDPPKRRRPPTGEAPLTLPGLRAQGNTAKTRPGD